MYDTIRLRSRTISEDVAEAIARLSRTKQAFDNATGEMLYEFTSVQLEGSYDHRISLEVKRQEWVTLSMQDKKKKAVPVLRDCPPYLIVEGSVHKAMLGHNVYGGSVEFAPSCRWFLNEIAERAHVVLPVYDRWHVERVDVAEVYDMGSFDAVQDFMRGLSAAEYPRRKALRYGTESIMFPSRNVSIKAYHKGVEFSAHDWKRLCKVQSVQFAEDLQHYANRLLRVEVGIKALRLQAEYGEKVYVEHVSDEWLHQIHDDTALKMLKEGKADMETVRTSHEVYNRLTAQYEGLLASVLYATWSRLSLHGEAVVKAQMTARTYYRQRSQLLAAGCSWAGTDIQVRSSCIPLGFSPVRADRHRLLEVAENVEKKCAEWRIAA